MSSTREIARLVPDGGCGFRASVSDPRNDQDPQIAQAVARAQAGDREALRFLYVRYKDNVYGYVLSILHDEHESEDVTQQVFLKLISAITKYRPREVPFTAWLVRVARNAALDQKRQRRLVPCEEVFAQSAAVDDSRHERRQDLKHAMQALPHDQRGVVVLRHLLGLSPAEIAAHMGRTESSIHGLHHRARHNMRRELASLQSAPTARRAA